MKKADLKEHGALVNLVKALDRCGASREQVIVIDKSVIEACREEIEVLMDGSAKYAFSLEDPRGKRFDSISIFGYTIHFTTCDNWHQSKTKEKTMNIKPILNRVVIKQDEAQLTTASGLFIPDAAKEKPLSGTIVAKGDTANLVEVGDVVMYQKYRGTDITIGGVNYMIMQQEDILAIV